MTIVCQSLISVQAIVEIVPLRKRVNYSCVQKKVTSTQNTAPRFFCARTK